MKFRLLTLFLFLVLLLSGIIPYALSDQGKPNNFDAIEYYNQAVDNASSGKFEKAANLTDMALSIQPNFTLALITRTGVLLELGRMDEAHESLQKALSLAPDNPAVLAAAASYSLRTGKNRDAIEYANQAVTKDPSMTEAWIIKGTAHGNVGEYTEEIKASEEALNGSPGNTLALSNRDYANNMLKQTKKSPMGFPGLIFALVICVFISRHRN